MIMSEKEKREWFDNLETVDVHSPGNIRICDQCGEFFSLSNIEYHFPHRKQDARWVFSELEQVKPILKLRFVLLEKSVTIQLLECDKQRLGLAPKPFRFGAADGYNLHYAPHYGLNIDVDTIEFGDKTNEIAFCENVDFALIKQALSEFAESLQEKPVPRIERNADFEYFVHFEKEAGKFKQSIDAGAINLLQNVGIDLPIYEPKQMRGVWAREMPREFTKADFYLIRGASDDYGNHTDYDLRNADYLPHFANQVNTLNISPIESWIFEIYE